VDWDLIFRLCEQRLKMRKWEASRYTLTQLLNALDFSDPSDPHAGGIPISSLAELDDMFG
jgi:hypothetical protein